MSASNFTKPNVVQDFGIRISAGDIKDGKLTEPAAEWLARVLIDCTYRFLPQVSPGKSIEMNLRMETER